MRPRGSQTSLEQRRRLGIDLLQQGLSLDEVSRRVGCHASSVFRWREAYRQNGRTGIRAKPILGRPPKLVARDLGRLAELLRQGPKAHGYHTDLWTTSRIARLIRKHFGVRYHRDHIGRLMANLNWTYVKPREKAWSEQSTRAVAWARGWMPLCKRPRGKRSLK